MQAASVCGIGLAAWLVWLLWPRESLIHAANRSTDCVLSGNADCVYSLMLDKERNAQDVTPSKLTALLRDYVLPPYEETVGAPNKDLLPLKDQGEVVSVYKWPRTNRSSLSIAMMVAATPEGARSVNTVRNIIFHAFDAKYRKSPSEPRILVDIDGISHDADKLTALGFKGIYNPDTDSVDDWQTVLASYRKKAADHGLLPVQ